jgi:CRISPR-associated protein Cmr4
MIRKHLIILTRTPLHVGAGASVGAIDQPIQRERHTGFPIIPGSSLKGSFADLWNASCVKDDKNKKGLLRGDSDAAWLFGSDGKNDQFSAGSLLFSEARLLAFPVRSAKGSYAWITSPLALQRAQRDGLLPQALSVPAEPGVEEAVFLSNGAVAVSQHVILEEYCLKGVPNDAALRAVAAELQKLLPKEPVWTDLEKRLVILSNHQMSFFATTACEVAQHVSINDETGTAEDGKLFNQENVPSDTLFYSVLHATAARIKSHAGKTAEQALEEFGKKLNEVGVCQFGGDASTGLGYCTVLLR